MAALAPGSAGSSRLIYLVPWNRGLKNNNIVIFTYKRWLLTIDMKTNVVDCEDQYKHLTFDMWHMKCDSTTNNHFFQTFRHLNYRFPALVWLSDIFIFWIKSYIGNIIMLHSLCPGLDCWTLLVDSWLTSLVHCSNLNNSGTPAVS